MIPQRELMEIKQRLMVATDVAGRIASSPDPFVLYDEDQYRAVVSALVSSREDAVRVFAELDVLRAMFMDRLQSFFMEGLGDGNVGVSEVPVAAVPDSEDRGSSPEVRQDDAGTGGGVPASGPARKRPRRSKSRRNPPGDGEVQGELGRSDGAVAVDGSPNPG